MTAPDQVAKADIKTLAGGGRPHMIYAHGGSRQKGFTTSGHNAIWITFSFRCFMSLPLAVALHRSPSRLLLLTLAACLGLAHPARAGCLKKGLAASGKNPPSLVQQLNVAWYYNWSVVPFKAIPSNISFVPMIHGLKNVGKISSPVPIILGFNEPNLSNQSNMTVSQAIAAWPQVQSIAQVVGAPAIAGKSASARPWLTTFMSGIRQNNLKVDFIPIHLYGPPDPTRLLALVDSVHAEFGLPIWVTEFAVRNNATNAYTPEQALAYMQAVLPALESRSYVQRFAWFGGPGEDPAKLAPSRLVDDGGALTPLGQFYASFPESGTTLCR